MILVKNLKHLTFFSLLGFCTVLYTTLIVVIYSFDSDLYDLEDHLNHIKLFDVSLKTKNRRSSAEQSKPFLL